MPKRYAKEFRRAICEQLVAGERVSKPAHRTLASRSILDRSPLKIATLRGVASLTPTGCCSNNWNRETPGNLSDRRMAVDQT